MKQTSLMFTLLLPCVPTPGDAHVVRKDAPFAAEDQIDEAGSDLATGDAQDKPRAETASSKPPAPKRCKCKCSAGGCSNDGTLAVFQDIPRIQTTASRDHASRFVHGLRKE